MNLKLVLAFIVAALLVLFTAQNYEVVELRLLFWKIEMSRAIMLFAVLAAGVVLGWLSRGFKG
jgi:putative membrane protein